MFAYIPMLGLVIALKVLTGENGILNNRGRGFKYSTQFFNSSSIRNNDDEHIKIFYPIAF